MTREGRRLLFSLLEIAVPVIAAVNGPATKHAELALLSDIVSHRRQRSLPGCAALLGRMVPGDGVHVIWPLLLGPNRGRYFLLTGQMLSAREALELGVVNEVLAPEDLLPRAWELAEQLAQAPTLALRYTRTCMMMVLRRLLHETLDSDSRLRGWRWSTSALTAAYRRRPFSSSRPSGPS